MGHVKAASSLLQRKKKTENKGKKRMPILIQTQTQRLYPSPKVK